MKKIIVTFALVLVANIGMAQDAAYTKDVMRVVENSPTVNQIKAVKAQILKQIPDDKKAAFTIDFDASFPSLYDKLAKVYMETYTKEDIKAMLAFYDSPVGKKIAEKEAGLNEKAQESLKEWGEGLQSMMMKYMQ